MLASISATKKSTGVGCAGSTFGATWWRVGRFFIFFGLFRPLRCPSSEMGGLMRTKFFPGIVPLSNYMHLISKSLAQPKAEGKIREEIFLKIHKNWYHGESRGPGKKRFADSDSVTSGYPEKDLIFLVTRKKDFFVCLCYPRWTYWSARALQIIWDSLMRRPRLPPPTGKDLKEGCSQGAPTKMEGHQENVGNPDERDPIDLLGIPAGSIVTLYLYNHAW